MVYLFLVFHLDLPLPSQEPLKPLLPMSEFICFLLRRSKLLWALFIVASQYSKELSRGYVAPSLFLKPNEEQINLFLRLQNEVLVEAEIDFSVRSTELGILALYVLDAVDCLAFL